MDIGNPDKEEIARLRDGLNEILKITGIDKLCETYEICNHPACDAVVAVNMLVREILSKHG